MSLLPGRRTKGMLLAVFTHFCRFSKGAFCSKSPISTGKNGRLRQGKLLTLIGHIGNETRQFSVSFLWYSGSSIFSNAGRFYWLTRYVFNAHGKMTKITKIRWSFGFDLEIESFKSVKYPWCYEFLKREHFLFHLEKSMNWWSDQFE